MALLVLGATTAADALGVGAAARLGGAILLGLACYFPLLAWRAPGLLGEVRRAVRGRGGGRPEPAAG
jgi:hypothetical protein